MSLPLKPMAVGGAAASGFAQAQQKALRRILRANAPTSLYAQLNMTKLGAYKDFELMYQAFVRAAPVQSPRAFVESLGKLLQLPGLPNLQVLNSPNLVVRGRPIAATMFRGQPMPVEKGIINDFLDTEGALKKLLADQGIRLEGSFYYLNEVEPQSWAAGSLPLKGWHHLVDAARGWMRQRWVLPRTAAMPNAGTSRYQWFSAHWDQLKALGKQVEVLVIHPKTLLDFALYVSQQEGQFVPLVRWCPNLKVLVFTAHDVALQRTELGYLLAGLPEVKWLQWVYQPGGLNAWQGDINIRQRLMMPGDGSVFYEFIPVEDIYPDGRFVRNYRRLHGGQLESGREYLVLISNTSGWLALSSGQVVRVLGPMDPSPDLKIAPRGQVVRLNGLAEGFREDGVLEALANINMALNGHGVFIRDALLGHHVAERQPMWVLEVSRPLAEVPQSLMESIAKRLHSELELRYEVYRANTRQGNIKPAVVHFVPIGTFAAATPQVPDLSLFDHSTEAAGVRKILSPAWQSQQNDLG